MIEELKEFITKTREEIKYGWFDTKGNLREHIDSDLMIEYRNRSPEETRKLGYGLCWDITELQRDYLESKNAKFMTVFVCINNIMIKHPNHTFVIVEYNNKFYWSESGMKNRLGVYEFDTLEDLKNKIIEIFPEIANKEIPEEYLKEIEFFAYERPKYGIKAIDFFVHAVKGNKI